MTQSNIKDSRSLYIEHIRDYPLLNKEQMTALAKEAQNGNNEALKFMMLCNTRLVITIAKNMQEKSNCGHVPLEDLVQYGNEGLLLACMGYKPEKGPAFVSYAGPYIRHTIKRNVENFGTVIRYPISFQIRMQRYKLAYNKLLQQYGREPTNEELAKEAKITEAQVKEIKKWSKPSSIDTAVGDDKTTNLGDLVEDPGADANIVFYKQERLNDIYRLLNEVLDEREYKIVLMRNSLYDDQKHTLEEIGDYFSLSRERIRQIYDVALKKLKADPEVRSQLEGYLDDIGKLGAL